MNIQDIRYVAEIARTGSMTQAAINLYMNQPNLSKSIIALEKELGISIFRRSSKGVALTKEGNDFLLGTKEILEKFEAVEAKYKSEEMRHYFGISVPRASYISYAFTQFVAGIANAGKLQIDFAETSSRQAIEDVVSHKHNFGIIRYGIEDEKYYNKLLSELDLRGDMLFEFEYLIVMSDQGPLADQKVITQSELVNLIEIIHGDNTIPVLAQGEIRRSLPTSETSRNIYIYERGSQFDLLTNVPSTYMWVSPIPPDMLMRYQLIQKKVTINNNCYRDVLIFPKSYQMTDTDRKFLGYLYKVRDTLLE